MKIPPIPPGCTWFVPYGDDLLDFKYPDPDGEDRPFLLHWPMWDEMSKVKRRIISTLCHREWIIEWERLCSITFKIGTKECKDAKINAEEWIKWATK